MPKVSLSSASAISSGPVRPVTRASTRAPRRHSAARVGSPPATGSRSPGSRRWPRRATVSRRRAASPSRRAALAPDLAAVDGILGDALVELGRYDEAFAAFDRMAARKPSLAAYSRVAYARELLGRPAAAISAMRLAVGAGAGQGENEAWALVELGHLHFNSGRLRPAERAYREALARFPGYHRALAGLPAYRPPAAASTPRSTSTAAPSTPCPYPSTRRRWARCSRGRGARPSRRRPMRSWTRRSGCSGRTVCGPTWRPLSSISTGAGACPTLSRARARRTRSAGASTQKTSSPGRSTRTAAVRRPASIRSGLCDSAPRDALKFFHRGLIERCLGRREEGDAFLRRALAVNPYFSLRYVPIAKEALR